MPRSILAAVLLGAAALAACSPTFNWREVRVAPTALHAMLPCKPDKAERQAPLAGKDVSLEVLGCETGGATFAILHADLGQAGLAAEALAQWRTATDANLRATASIASPFRPAGALALPQSLQVQASGQRANGTAVEGRSAYFAHGSQVFQAVIYADRIQPEFSDPFFAGLRFP
jgi:hypothetical protein